MQRVKHLVAEGSLGAKRGTWVLVEVLVGG